MIHEQNQERTSQSKKPNDLISSHRLKTSCKQNSRGFFSMCSKSQSRKNVISVDFRKVHHDFLVRHTCSKPTQNVLNSNSSPFNTWFSKSNVWVYADKFFAIIKFHSFKSRIYWLNMSSRNILNSFRDSFTFFRSIILSLNSNQPQGANP